METIDTVTIPRPDTDVAMPVYRWTPENPHGAVVLVQEIFGVSTYIRRRAADLAAAGYVVDVPVVYFRLPEDVVADDDPDLLAKGMGMASATGWDQAVDDVVAALENLRADLPGLGVPNRVGLVGFCYGGGLAYAATAKAEAAAAAVGQAPPVDALVSYYGSALPGLLDLTVITASLHHFGTADTFIPMDQVSAIRDHVVASGARFELYEGAGHAFDNTLPAFHHAEAADLAWPRTLEFLDEHVG